MTAIKTTAIRAVTDDPDTHTVALKQLKEIAELALRIRGNPLDSYVRVSELIDAGVVRFVDNTVVAANTALSTSAVPASRRIIAGTGLTGGGDLSADRTLTVDDSHWSTVAFTGAYADLSGTPTIPTVPLTTKGDLWGFSSVNARIPVGTDTYVLTADSGAALGVSWQPAGAPTPAALTKTDDTNVTLSLGGTPATALLAAASLTLGWTGTLAVARGGSGAGTLTGYLIGNGTSAFTASATIPYSDLSGTPTIPSVTPSALTKTDDTNVTLTLGGTPATALLQAASLTLGWSGTLAVARGGTGAATLTGHLSGNGTSAITASSTIPASDLSGTLAAAQFPALTGDVTTVAGALATTIANDAVTYAKMQNISATSRILGRITAGAGDTEELTAANVKTILSISYTDVSGLATVAHTGAYSDLTGTPTAVTPSALTKADDTNVTLTLGGTPATALLQAASLTLGWTGTLAVARGGTGAATLTGYMKGNGTSAVTAAATVPTTDLAGTLAAAQFPALTGDVTTVAGALAATIANDAVTYAKMQNVSATSRILGRITAGAGDTEELTSANVKTILALSTADLSDATSGTYTGTLTGCTTTPTVTVRWARVGNLVTITIPAVSATSNTTACTITGSLPAAIQPALAQTMAFGPLKDNGSANLNGPFARVDPASSTITFGFGGTSTGFTTSGSKGISSNGSFSYQLT